jgi:putative flippase GtrA
MPVWTDRTHRIGSFLIVGLIGFVVDAGLLTLGIHGLGFGPELSRLMSFLAAVFVTWMLNRSFTFADKATGRRGRELARYVMTSCVSALLNLGVYLIVLTVLPDRVLTPYIALVCGVGMGLISNFTLYRLVVFR